MILETSRKKNYKINKYNEIRNMTWVKIIIKYIIKMIDITFLTLVTVGQALEFC